jgi:hypothetical protein
MPAWTDPPVEGAMEAQNTSEDTPPPGEGKLARQFHEETRLKLHEQREHDEKYRAELKRKHVKGTASGAAAGFVIAFLMVWPSILFTVLIGLAEAGIAYLIVKREPDHLVCMGLPPGAAIVLSAVGIATGCVVIESPLEFIRLLAGWGSLMGAGGMLGLWMRTKEVDAL